MIEFLRRLFDGSDFVPRSQCGHWSPDLIRLHNWSDGAIWFSYMAIPVVLIYFVRSRRDVPFPKIFWMFGGFIVLCGLTHFMDIVMFSTPMYRLSGLVKLATAAISLTTFFALIPLVPVALSLKSPRVLEEVNRRLEAEILERKKAEAELSRKNAELREKEDELRGRVRDLEVLNKELESFCYAVSHDLRAPLRAIDGFSKIIAESETTKLDGRDRDYFDRIRAASQRMSELIDALLALSRLTRSELRPETVDLTALAESVAEDLRRSAPAREVEFAIARGMTATGDPRLLRAALENLLGNSWKFTRNLSKARIEVGVGDKDGRRTFFVRDNGAGFDMAYAEKLFGPFQRLHRPDEFEGTGVGLATVQRIIHRHGGAVWATGETGAGATFSFTLGV